MDVLVLSLSTSSINWWQTQYNDIDHILLKSCFKEESSHFSRRVLLARWSSGNHLSFLKSGSITTSLLTLFDGLKTFFSLRVIGCAVDTRSDGTQATIGLYPVTWIYCFLLCCKLLLCATNRWRLYSMLYSHYRNHLPDNVKCPTS